MSMLAGLLLAAQVSSRTPDCGAIMNRAAIERTKALIKKKVVPVYNSELANLSQKAVCVRIQFSISADGRATNARIAEGYYDRAFNKAVLEAIRRFTFRVPKDHEKAKFMIIFRPAPLLPVGSDQRHCRNHRRRL